jgi:hypothetical protein
MRLYPKRCKLVLTASDGAKTEQADFSTLDFEFSVHGKLPLDKKDKNKTDPITATVTLYNLNESTREKLTAQKSAIRLEYGYGDDIFEIFEGLNTNVFSVLQTPSGWRTEIFAKHNWEAYKLSFFSKSYEDEVPLKTVLEDVLKSFGLPYTNLYKRADKLIGGAFFDGESKSILDKLARDWDLNWRIDGGSITLEDSLAPPLAVRTRVVILGPSLLSGPSMDESLEDEGQKTEKVVRRVSASSILLPQLWPGVPVKFDVASFGRSSSAIAARKMSSFDPNAIFICNEVTHKGGSGARQGVTEIVTKEEKA